MSASPLSAECQAEAEPRKPNQYGSDREVRWCPGCGDYSILSQVRKALSTVNLDPDKTAFVSGIGCSSRFPYYMATYGVHGIHGRALPIATGLKIARPDISVWVATGDGDALSIGGNHLMHAMRKNVDIKVAMFNNRIYGLTKGQASPTSAIEQVTASTPYGVIEPPVAPISLALGCEGTFVARSIDMNPKHLADVLTRAAQHKGFAFVEVYQNCVIFNNNAYQYATNRETRDDALLMLEHGKPMIFGKERNKGIRLVDGYKPEVVEIGENGISVNDLLVHDETREDPTLAFMLSRFHYPSFPEPMGIFRAVESPTLNEAIDNQIAKITAKYPPDLQALLTGDDTWEVE